MSAMNRAHVGSVLRMLAVGLTSFAGCTAIAAQHGPDAVSPAGDTSSVPADQCTLQFVDLWDCEAGRWRDAAQDTLHRAMVEVQEEIPDSEDEIERRINGMCSLDMLTWEIGDVVMSSGSRRRPVSCYIAQATLDEVERFRTGAKVKEAANVSQGACRNFYRENFFAGMLKAYRAGRTNPLRVACGEAFAAGRVGIYRKGSPEAVVVRKMQLLAGDSCDFNCHLEIIGLYSRRYLQAQKGFWLAIFEQEAAQGKKNSLHRLFGRWASLERVREQSPLEFMARLQSKIHDGLDSRIRFTRVKIIERRHETEDEVVLNVRYGGLPDAPKYEETESVHLVREDGHWRIDR